MFYNDVFNEIISHLNINDSFHYGITCKTYYKYWNNSKKGILLNKHSLLNHQIKTINWIFSQEKNQKDGIINLETGAGKSCIISYLANSSEKMTAIVVGPLLAENWIRDIKKFYDTKVINFSDIGKNINKIELALKSSRILKDIELTNILITRTPIYYMTKYKIILFDKHSFFHHWKKEYEYLFDRIVVDEIHNISNQSDMLNIISRINIHKWGLTANKITKTAFKQKKYNIFAKEKSQIINLKIDVNKSIPNFIDIPFTSESSKYIIRTFKKNTRNMEFEKFGANEIKKLITVYNKILEHDIVANEIYLFIKNLKLSNNRIVIYTSNEDIVYKMFVLSNDNDNDNDNFYRDFLGYGANTIENKISQFLNKRSNILFLPFRYNEGLNFDDVDNLIIVGMPATYSIFCQIVGRVNRIGFKKANLYYFHSSEPFDSTFMKKYVEKYTIEK